MGLIDSSEQHDLALEKHYTVNELSSLWGVSRQVVTRWFENDPDVLRFGTQENRHTRGKISLRVPESVAIRVHRQRRRVQ